MLGKVKRAISSIDDSEYWITRFVLLRLLGFVYFMAFLSLAAQVLPLIGHDGLLPADNFLNAVGSSFDSKVSAFVKLPTIFWLGISDNLLLILAWAGVILSFIVLMGFANMPLLLILWALYLSFVNIGQLFYSYGWEIQLIETGLLAIFLCPPLEMRPFPKAPPPKAVIWLFRWLAFRIYIGAGLIKLRGDSCWRDLTCLYYHYETQPIPNPVSRILHFFPQWFHVFGVVWNHFVELVVPFFAFSPRLLRLIAGLLMVSFQLFLIISGNLSFLNWLTIIPCIACFDDKFFRKVMPSWVVKRAEHAALAKETPKYHAALSIILVIAVALLSMPVIQNLISSSQYMNYSFDNFHFVNTYGAFGSIGKARGELIIEGTQDEAITENTEWEAYEFKAKPGGINRNLPIIAPYQPRIDWQIWFAAMETPEQNPWLIHFIWKLLHNDKGALSLIDTNPFPDAPPKYIRVDYYHYRFAPLNSTSVWERQKMGSWLPPLSATTPGFGQYVKANGWS